MKEIEERVLIGLFHADTVGTVLSELEPDDFEDQLTSDIYIAAKEIFGEGSLVEPMSVLRKLEHIYGDTEELEKALRYFAAAEPTNLTFCINELQDNRRYHRIQDLAVRLELSESLADAEKIISELSLLSAKRERGIYQTGAAAANEFANTMNDRLTNGAKIIKWGFPPMDNGLYTRHGNFVILGARPSTGKSALALQCALNMARAGHRVVFFSMEMSSDEINSRIISQLSGVPMDKITRGKLQDDDIKRTYSACEFLYRLPIGFDYAARTVPQVKARALSERAEIVFVDYLQLMNGEKTASRYETVTAISQGLQQFSHRNSVLTVALSQLSRPQKLADGQERKPSLTDLRESGGIEQDADVVLLMALNDSNDFRSDRLLTVAKNRQGQRFAFPLRFHGDTQYFEFQRCTT